MMISRGDNRFVLAAALLCVATMVACAPVTRPAAIDATPLPSMEPAVSTHEEPGSNPTRFPQDQAALDAGLIVAAGGGDLERVRMLLEQGAGVTATDARGRTALIAAAYGNFVEIAHILVEAGADPNVKDDLTQSAYLIPTADGNLEFLRLMLAHGGDVRSLDRFNGTGLIRAADRGHVEIIRELLTTEIDVDHINNLGWTALLEAVLLGDGSEKYDDTVRLLIAGGADVDLADGQGVTPLAHARRLGYAEIVRLLEEAGAR